MTPEKQKIFETIGRTNVHIDYHTPPFQMELGADFDGDALGQALKEANADSVTFFAKDYFGMAFYDTKIGFRHPNLQKDMLKEAIAGCHKHGVKVIAYYSLALDSAAGNLHQDWIQVAIGGKPAGNYPDGAVSYVCMNSPYMEENLIPMVIETIRNYDVDGFFFDELYIAVDGCVCPACVKNMKLRGLDPESLDDLRYFRSLTCDIAADRVTRAIHHYKPGLPVVYNPTIKILGQMDTLVQNENLIVVGGHETGWGYINMMMEARHVRNYDLPIMGMNAIFHRRWGDFGTVKHEAQLGYEVAEMLSHHFLISIGDHHMPRGEIEQAKYDAMGRAFAKVKELNLPLEAKPVYDVGIIHPGIYDGMQLRLNVDTSDSPRAVWPFDNGMCGAVKYLCDAHQQCDVLSDPLAVNLISRLNTVILPESPALSDKLCDKLRKFVADGGTLIATGIASLDKGKFALADVLGVAYLNEPNYTFDNSPYIRLLDYTDGIPEGVDVKMYTCPINVHPMPDAEVKGYIVSPVAAELRYTRGFRGGPAEHLLCDPAIVAHNYGKGKAIYIAFDIFRSYFKYVYHGHRQLIANILQSVQKNRVLESDCSANIHLNLMRCEDGVYLHTIQYYPEDGGGTIPRINCWPPKQDIEVAVNLPGINDIVSLDGTKFEFDKTAAGVRIRLKDIGQYHVLKLIVNAEAKENAEQNLWGGGE